jgi:hypothetical protein
VSDPNRPYPGAHGGPPRTSRPPWLGPVAVLVTIVVLWGGFALVSVDDGGDESDPTADEAAPDDTEATEQVAVETTGAPLPPFDGWVNPASSGRMWSEEVPGILTFRGNPTRSYYGEGPVPAAPQVLWTYPQGTMCGNSTDGGGTQTWCGTGWTGQPNVYERDGRTVVSFGAYDYGVHWVDAETGTDLRPAFETGDIIKGTVTTDPDGYPLTYSGSRDNYYRVLATDRPGEAVELWKLGATDFGVQKVWNDDWDGSGLVIDDYLFEGGENSWFYIVKLKRAYDADGLVTVNPELVFRTPSWDADLEAVISDRQFSIENSVAISGNTVYFSNSAGLVQGWDITGLKEGVEPTRVFRFWTGDDTDASIVIDPDGFLYVGSEYERRNTRSTEVGQIMKLDPRNPENPLVWSVEDQAPGKQGVWGTPALADGVVYADTNAGRVMGIDQQTGAVLWEKNLGSQTWQSPVVVDDRLIIGDCQGVLRAYDVSDPRVDPPEVWAVQLEGCIESTPAVWKGRIYVGTRGGRMYALGDPPALPAPAAEPAATR